MGSITLNWTDNNTTETGHKVYRSESPMTVGSLPAPLATLGANITTYKDEAIVDGETYYYRTSALRGLSEAVSAEIMVKAIAGNLLVAPSGLVLELIDGGGEEPAPDLPTIIGEPFGGGFYAGDIEYDGQWYKLIVAPVEGEVSSLRWKTSTTNTPGTSHLSDGMANTESMSAAAAGTHPAASYCVNYGAEGDWYMPSRNESITIYNNLGFNRPGCPEEFLVGGSQAFHTNHYWTSTLQGSGWAWVQDFSNNSLASARLTDTDKRVRPVRRIAFTPPAAQEPIPTTIGEQIGGGFYAGDIESDGQMYTLIVADKSADITGANSRWKTSNSATAGADSLTDGVANTSAMIAAGIELHPAANHCINHTGGGKSDWYMPAKDELNVIYQNLGFNRPNCPSDFLRGASQAFASEYYWASTQASSGTGWVQHLDYGNQPSNVDKSNSSYRVRPVRRIKKS